MFSFLMTPELFAMITSGAFIDLLAKAAVALVSFTQAMMNVYKYFVI